MPRKIEKKQNILIAEVSEKKIHIEKPHNQDKYVSMISILVETIDGGEKKKSASDRKTAVRSSVPAVL